MPLDPFHNDSTRPSDGTVGVVCDNAEQIVGAALAAMLLLWLLRSAFALRSAVHKSPNQRGPPVPSGGRAQVLCRGAFGTDAKRGTMGHEWPTVTTLETVPERGESGVARPVCRVCFLFGYFLFAQAKRKSLGVRPKPVVAARESAAGVRIKMSIAALNPSYGVRRHSRAFRAQGLHP